MANLDTLLTALGIANQDEVKASLLSDEPNDEILADVLKKAQAYSRPFLESEFNEKSKAERAQAKGKYMKETLLKANKIFGNALSNKEIDEIMSDPENAGNTIDAALDALKEKVSSKSGTPEAELQKMLEIANGKIADYETKIPQITADAERKANEAIEKFKLDGVVTKKLLEVLADKTDNPAKVAELIKGQLSQKAMIRLKEDGNIALFDIANPETPLKKNETTLQTFEGLVGDTVEYFGLTKKSPGTQRVALNHKGGNEHEPQQKTGGLAAKLSAVAAE